MIYIALGTLGFIIVHLFDIVSLKRIPSGAKPCVWIVGGGLLIYSLVMLCLQSSDLPLPIWTTWLGWGLLTIALSLLVYSLFLNLPFRKTYITTGVSDKLVTTGLYALVRHPGVIWFVLLMLSLILVSKSSLILIAAPIFILLDIVLVIVQDKILFIRMFDGYKQYQRETPMLMPNRRSINTFAKGARPTRAK
ncbi:MAG: hypothetical protein DRI01_06440 [Chloroflexi bacterium]|nr:MAG: hypothetical protein DRI01_06440 [Chloroflexota bacterium]